MRFGQGATEDGKVLTENVDESTVDGPKPRDDSVTIRSCFFQTEVARTMANERSELFEGARIEQDVETLACGQLALGMLSLDAFGPASFERFRAKPI